jgi:hypothetical protein
MSRVWPSTIPQRPDYGGWDVRPQKNTIAFEPEIGPPITRRRASAANIIADAKFTLRTDAQRADWITFFHTTLVDGSLDFTWNDPITGVSSTWKIMGGEYRLRAADGFQKHELSVTVIRL